MSNFCDLKVLRRIFSEHMDLCTRNLGVGLVVEIVTSKILPQGTHPAALQAQEGREGKDGSDVTLGGGVAHCGNGFSRDACDP